MVAQLAQLIEDWRLDTRTTEDLQRSAERFIGDAWIAGTQEHEAVHALRSAFRDECILGRGGMTMNERLCRFDLLEAWDSAPNQESRAAIQMKVDVAESPSP
jgi:hypothetical protein